MHIESNIVIQAAKLSLVFGLGQASSTANPAGILMGEPVVEANFRLRKTEAPVDFQPRKGKQGRTESGEMFGCDYALEKRVGAPGLRPSTCVA